MSLSNSLPTSPVEPNENGFLDASLVAMPSSLCSFQEEEEDEILDNNKIQINSFRSRLSKTLPEILADKSALGYFIQFMDSRKEISLIKFWLEVECLCGAYSNQESLVNSDDSGKGSKDLISSTKTENVDNCACSIISTSVSDFELDSISLDNSVNNNEQDLVSNI